MRSCLIALAFLAASYAAEVNVGKPLALKQPMPIATLLAHPAEYVGKPVQVKGKITEVCQMMGCWMNLTDADGKTIRIKVNDGELEFPKDSAGKTAIAEGRFSKIELTREQAVAEAKHEADEMGRKFDAAKVKTGKTIYQIQGSGAVIE
jgi:hypothetical protein